MWRCSFLPLGLALSQFTCTKLTSLYIFGYTIMLDPYDLMRSQSVNQSSSEHYHQADDSMLTPRTVTVRVHVVIGDLFNPEIN